MLELCEQPVKKNLPGKLIVLYQRIWTCMYSLLFCPFITRTIAQKATHDFPLGYETFLPP